MVKQGIRSSCFAVAALAVSGQALAVAPPRDGGPLPPSYFEVRGKDRAAFTHQRAWVKKAQRIRDAREAYLAAPGALAPLAPLPQALAVSGTFRVPVLPGYFANETPPGPVSAQALQNQLFDSNPTGTVTQYYHEVSYGQLTVDGDLQGWVQVTNDDTYFEGSCNGIDPACSKTGEFIQQLIGSHDGALDFSLYDNDGPDNIPDSGDDDGFVDAVVIIQSQPGGECSALSPNIHSHSWVYSAWPNSGGNPYVTNDPATGGGFIRIDEYVIVPAGNCGAVAPYTADEVIDIGVLCHELGHALGLPDLYDLDGGGYGIGHWGIMGSGSWNTVERPAHPEAWTRQEMGWVTPTDIGWQATAVSIANIEQNAVAYRLPFTDERFRRSTSCVIAGSYSLYCGLTAAEAATRNWPAPGPGYGPNWYETIERDFSYAGSGAVAFQYKYSHDTEPAYDFAYALIEVNGVETVLATYTGTTAMPGTANIDLTTHLAPLAGAGGVYTLKFRVVSDVSFDDADGQDPSTCGAFSVDDVSVSGGGESYATGFETSVEGWHQDPAENPSSEYWLVENRRALGFDENLPGEGLLIWHVDNELLHAPFVGNMGTGGNVRGLVLEEAEGVFDLNGAGANQGEAADVFPGSTNNTSFTSATTPDSDDNTARPTRIEVTSISAAAPTMTATLRAGDPGPQASAILPTTIDNDQTAVQVTVSGARIRHGATFRFVYSGTAAAAAAQPTDPGDMVATSLEWVDGGTLRGTVNAYLKTPGSWNLVVTNPDGQTVALNQVLLVNWILAARLVSADIDVIDAGVRLRYVLRGREPGEVIRLYRSSRPDGGFVAIGDDLQAERGDDYVFVDENVVPGGTYHYVLESRLESGETRELHRGVATVPAREMVLEQNHPNPFNPRTSIRFYLPARSAVELAVFDVRGALVRRLAGGSFDVGPHVVEWNGTDADGRAVSSGVYVYRLRTELGSVSRKMILLK
jgi:M6 family metalloprotease-like protein